MHASDEPEGMLLSSNTFKLRGVHSDSEACIWTEMQAFGLRDVHLNACLPASALRYQMHASDADYTHLIPNAKL